ncbi:MAG TPA: gamma-glutamyltransferase, partial [Candidatus Bathyarchaeota archaeon]|nr:gamma-glutamyltransferase [Candidatus Bathyarchaeota archaeon]
MGKGRLFKLHKQEIIAGKGVITSNHPEASSAGVEMYAKGGNAFDAAIASLFALTVVEPMMVSVFGAGFFVVRDGETGKVETLDNYAVAPFAAHDRIYEMVKERLPGMDIFETVGRKNITGPLAVATPGTLKAWEHVNRKYGALSFKTVIQPAIRLAREGYRSSHYMEFILSLGIDDMKKFPETAKTYLPEGKPVKPGTLITLPEYAESLELIAKKGSDAMYNGELGKAVVDYMEDNGGILTARDLREYQLIERKPVTGTYRDDYELYAMAPGSSGGTHI